MLRDFFDEALHEGRLARAGLAADDDGLVLAHGQAQELGVAAGVLAARAARCSKGSSSRRRVRVDRGRALEQAFALEVVEPLDQLRWLAHRDRDRAARDGRRDHELDALAARQRGRQQRPLLVDLLVAEGGDGGGQRQAALLRHARAPATVFQPAAVSTRSSPGRLTQTSSTPGASSCSRSGRRNSTTEVASPHQAVGSRSRVLRWRSAAVAHRGTGFSSYTDEKSTSRAT